MSPLDLDTESSLAQRVDDRPEPPSTEERPLAALAMRQAARIIDVSVAMKALPSRFVPDVDGGVAVYWMSADRLDDGSHRLLAAIFVDPDGQMSASTSDRAVSAFHGWDITADALTETVELLRGFAQR
jgi:hypothetical protein